ncbi:LysR family transcriptional regulator [Actinoplanes couchii]|uniref:LysR family transcriptional regulator n=1 Tax=Actinoplanes couchii TaxID=403638 RepID=A0ABQ3XP25_9ACTN|nr:LysR family transcriptional regulator [Actinoplanes couchii]MDR6318659.1 DNA-binding transcriptional LysR family regulator [Actinoplanes couchii]GID60266.1 LysR family transcriptional regulator [Actinoplanes couchii]
MDLIASCVAFIAVSRHASFTHGAAAAGIPQPVASRRIAALEQHLGAPVLDRTSRTVTLTPFGRDMLASAQRLVDFADVLSDAADRSRRKAFDLAVPACSTPLALARLIAEAERHDLFFDVVPADPGVRTDLMRAGEVHASITAVPAADGTWQVPLGVAGDLPRTGPTLYLEQLRPDRGGEADRRVWVQPEDDVPHVLDRIVRLAGAVGLHRHQIATARSVPGAVARGLGGHDLVLCSRAEADSFGLSWWPIGEEAFARGYDVVCTSKDDGRRLRTILSAAIAACVGAEDEENQQ